MKMFELLVSFTSLFIKKETAAGWHTVSCVRSCRSSSGCKIRYCLTNLVADSLERCGIVHGEVSENLAVDFHTCLVDESHELAV